MNLFNLAQSNWANLANWANSTYGKTRLQECIPVGCVPADRRPYAGVCFRGGVSMLGEGFSMPGGSPWWGVSGPGGFSMPGGWVLSGGSSPCPGGFYLPDPPVNRMTDRCKNITLAKTSFRPVIMVYLYLWTIFDIFCWCVGALFACALWWIFWFTFLNTCEWTCSFPITETTIPPQLVCLSGHFLMCTILYFFWEGHLHSDSI